MKHVLSSKIIYYIDLVSCLTYKTKLSLTDEYNYGGSQHPEIKNSLLHVVGVTAAARNVGSRIRLYTLFATTNMESFRPTSFSSRRSASGVGK